MANLKNFQVRSLASMQEEVDAYIGQFKAGYFPPMSQVVRLAEELGELAREVMHTYGEKQKKADEDLSSVEEELTDVFVNLLILANSLGIDLTANFEKNMEKFNHRDKDRFERNETND